MKRYIVLEYLDKGDIFDHLMCSEFGFSDSLSRYFFRQLMLGLDHAHFFGYSHRDVKLENLLLSQDNMIKLADFGFVSPKS